MQFIHFMYTYLISISAVCATARKNAPTNMGLYTCDTPLQTCGKSYRNSQCKNVMLLHYMQNADAICAININYRDFLILSIFISLNYIVNIVYSS